MIFAHQGGWDEILLVLVPIAAIVFLLRLARRRAEQQPVPPNDHGEPPPG